MPIGRNQDDESRYLWRVSGMGIELLGAILLCGGVGWLVDRYVVGGGARWLTVGALLGIAVGGYNFVRQALALNRRASEAYRREYPDGRRPPPHTPPPNTHHPPSPGGSTDPFRSSRTESGGGNGGERSVGDGDDEWRFPPRFED